MPWWIIFFILFRASNHKIVHNKDYDEFSFTALRFHFTLTLGYLNPALKNSAQLFLVSFGSVSGFNKAKIVTQ